LADVDLRQLAQMLRKKGRGRDTVLAHITPQEAKLLKARGGRGSINPKTGLPEFEDDFYDYGGGGDYYGGDYGGDYGGGGDYGPIYEYYDEPVQDATGSYEQAGPTEDATGSYEFAQETVPGSEEPAAPNPNINLLSATALTPEEQARDARVNASLAAIGQGGTARPEAVDPSLLDRQGNPILPPDPDTPEALAARSAFDAKYPEVARIAELPADNPERMRYEADIATRASQEPDFLSRLSSSLGLGNLGLGGNGVGGLLGSAGLLRLLAAGGAGATAVQAGNQAQAQSQNAANQIRDVAANAAAAGGNAQQQLNALSNQQQARADTAQAGIQQLADTANKRAVDLQSGLTGIASNAAARAADVQRQYNAIASPYQTQGREIAQMGLTGGLTPASAQAYQAAQARLAQQGISRGGVASAQAATQLESLRAQLLGDQYRQGLDTQQIGDRYASQGIAAGLAQSNLGDVLNANALNSGLAQYNYANNLSSNAITTGMSASAMANSLSSAGITAALNASGISNGYLIQAIQTSLTGDAAARQAMQGFWTQIGNFVGGGTGAGNTATNTARST
jgi:hypothetical protein